MNRHKVSWAAAVGLTLLMTSPTAVLACERGQSIKHHEDNLGLNLTQSWQLADNEVNPRHAGHFKEHGHQTVVGQINLQASVQDNNDNNRNQDCNRQNTLPLMAHDNEHVNIHVNEHSDQRCNGQANGHVNEHLNIHVNADDNGHTNGAATDTVNEHIHVHINIHSNGHAVGHTNEHVNVHINEHSNSHIKGTMVGDVNQHVNQHLNVHVNVHGNTGGHGGRVAGLLTALHDLHLTQTAYLYAYFENLHLSNAEVNHIAMNVNDINRLCHQLGSTGQPTVAEQQESWRLFVNTLSACHLQVSVTDNEGHPVDVFRETIVPVTAQLTDNTGHELATVKLSHPTSPTTLAPVMRTIKQAGSASSHITPQERSSPAITGKLPQTATSDPLLIAIGLLTTIVGALGLTGSLRLLKRS